MILGAMLKPFSIAFDILLAFIPKKLLVVIIIGLILAIYFGFNYEF